MEQIILQNEAITLTISTTGAEMTSLLLDGTEQLWEGNPSVWENHAPVLFPICGCLRDGRYSFGGKHYTMPSHGFAYTSVFAVEEKSDTQAVFLLRSNAQTKACYPFDFELRVRYSLEGRRVFVTYSTTNTGTAAMYYSAGVHTGFACPEGVDSYAIEFAQKESFDSTLLTEDGLLKKETIRMGTPGTTLPLNYDFCVYDSMVFERIQSRQLRLVHTPSGRSIAIDFADMPSLVLWTVPGGKYICIEPWCGLPDMADTDHDLTKKKGILCLAPGKTQDITHSMQF